MQLVSTSHSSSLPLESVTVENITLPFPRSKLLSNCKVVPGRTRQQSSITNLQEDHCVQIEEGRVPACLPLQAYASHTCKNRVQYNYCNYYYHFLLPLGEQHLTATCWARLTKRNLSLPLIAKLPLLNHCRKKMHSSTWPLILNKHQFWNNQLWKAAYVCVFLIPDYISIYSLW